MKNKVSVIIPTYNSAKTLSRAIESVIKQTYPVHELIVVDDCSTDNTKEVINSYQAVYLKLIYIRNTSNSGGAAVPKNIGIKRSTGDLIAILDADDEWLPEKIEKQLALFSNSRQSLSVVGCDYICFDTLYKQTAIRIKEPIQHSSLNTILIRDFLGPGSNLIYKKEIFYEIGFFDEDLKSAQDWEMRIRILKKYKIGIVNDFLVRYYMHDFSVTRSTNIEQRIKDIEKILIKHKNLYSQSILSATYLKLGIMFTSQGYLLEGRSYFCKVLNSKKFSTSILALMHLCLSFFGLKVYRTVFELKTKKSVLND